MTTTTMMVTTMALALGASTALAGDSRGPHGKGRGMDRGQRWDTMLEKHDSDADGRLSEAEFTARNERFEKLDANGDGVVTRAEIEAAAEEHPRLAQRLERMGDRVGDGLSLEELKARKAQAFARMDSDSDGYVEKGEFMAFKPERREGGPGREGGPRRGASPSLPR